MFNSTPEHQAEINSAVAGVTPAVAGQNTGPVVAQDQVSQSLPTPPAVSPVAAPPIGDGQQSVQQAPPVQNQPVAGQPQVQPDPVPYARFSQINDERNQYASQNAVLQQQLALQQANRGVAAPSISQPQPSALAEIADKLGKLDENEGIFGKEALEIVNAVNESLQDVQAQSQQNAFLALNPDFSQVVGVGEQIAAPLAHMINQYPQIQNTILASTNPYEAALTFGRMGQEQLQQQQQQAQPQAAPQPGQPGQPVQPIPVPVPGQYAQPQVPQQQYPGQPYQAYPSIPQPAMPISGLPGPSMTGVMAGVAPASISNFNTGTGIDPRTQHQQMSDLEFNAWRANNGVG